ncbi:efflux RND transporter permease subunit [Bdellovibrio sp. HCB290]|uniref:efflux RND transporter permease subunit n=1 Tax=Bdellovibrio sp. HCB290 TaxID=3394356 RepID=UPI0039B65515
MISKLVRFSIAFRWLIIFFTFLAALAGWFAFQKLPIDAVPDITNVQVQVNTAVEALSPEEIERTVTVPVEIALNGIPGVIQVRSITRFGISQVTVTFEDETDIYRARQLVSERLQDISENLPGGVHPKLGPVTSGLGEVYHYVIEAEKPATGSKRLDQLAEIRSLQDWYIKPRLLTVKGVAEVNTIGGHEKQYLIHPDPKKLSAYGVHFSDIEEAIERANKNAGGGYVEQTADQFLVQAYGLFESLDDIRSVPVRALENGRVISIGDLATVGIGKELRTGAALHNGKEAVLGTVLMLMGENSRTVALRVDSQIEEIRKGLPEGYAITTVYDRSYLVNATLSTIEHNLLVGAILVIVVLFLLVGNIRAALITAIVIPLSLLITFILMRRFGISGNLVSLGALDFGIIVDGAVIVLDNCVRHIHGRAKSLGRSLTGTELADTIHDATLEIRKSAGFGELIIIVVFLPIFAFVGIEGKMFVPMAATFIFAIFAALVLSFTFVPALASLILRGKVEDNEPWIMRKVYALYKPALGWGLGAKRAVISVAVVSVALGVFLFTRLGGEFLPQLDEGAIAIQFIRPVTVGISHSVALEERSQEIIKSFPEVKDVFGRIGTAEISMDPMGPNISDTYLMLHSESDWPLIDGKRRSKEQLIAAIVEELEATTPGQRILVSQPIQLRFNELMEGTRADVSLKVFGEDQAKITEIAESAMKVIQTVPGAGDVELEAKGTVTVLDIIPDKHMLRKMGVSSREVLESVGIGIGGHEVGTFYEGTKKYPITVRLKDEDRSNISSIKNLPVGIGASSTMALKDVAQLKFVEAYSSFSREQTKRRIAVLINPRGRDTESFVDEARIKVAESVKLPPGYYMEWGGNFKNLSEAKSRLYVLGPLALALVLLMIYAAFRNVFETALIFLCVPFALIGGVVALMIGGMPFSVSAGVGFIALSGIAVLNGVVLVNYFNELRDRGLSGNHLVEHGTMLRIRPVLMTALVDVFGFLPMALSTGMGAEVQRPLATVVMGGILSSTVLTLFVLPILYSVFEKQILAFAHAKKEIK